MNVGPPLSVCDYHVGRQWQLTTQFEAIYEHGILRPLKRLDLRENQQVRITLTDDEIDPLDEFIDHQYLAVL